jgi:NAD(P)-dependent dehydrogenase (short-subunit alcohol dehydrogenase family)
MDLTGRVALLTGASRGLGRVTARLLAARGVRLAVTARRPELLAAAATELSRSVEVLSLPGDVADPRHVERLVEATLDRFGQIDVLINNASSVGPSPMPALADYALDALEGVMQTNLYAPLRLAQLALPGMRRRRSGVIVNLSSDAGVEAYAGWGGYGASKAALDHLSRVLAVEIEGSGVRVYAVDPGDMNTETHQLAEPGVDLSHLPGPEESAPAIVRLIESDHLPSGRYTAQSLLTTVAA